MSTQQKFNKTYWKMPKEQKDAQFEKFITSFRQIDVRFLLSALGAEVRDGSDHISPLNVSKYKLHDNDIGNIIIADNGAWQAVNLNQIKGYGALDFVRKIFDLKLWEAVDYISEAFELDIQFQPNGDILFNGKSIEELDFANASAEILEEKVKIFKPPRPLIQYERDVVEYLNEKRNIPLSLIQETIDVGTLYASRYTYDLIDDVTGQKVDDGVERWETRCIFVGEASGEARSTRTAKGAFKGSISGSDATISGIPFVHHSGALKTAQTRRCMVLTEAAVDAMSYRAMFPERYTFSCNGSGSRFHLQYVSSIEGINHDIDIKIAFDADRAGDQAAQTVFNALIFRHQFHKDTGLPYELIDTWVREEKVKFEWSPSEHYNFFNSEEGWRAELPVSEPNGEYKVNQDGEREAIYIKTDKKAPPTYRFQVTNNIEYKGKDGKTYTLDRGVYENAVSRRDWLELTCNVMRERPSEALKDWNQELVELGVVFSTKYDQLNEAGFVELPKLPEHLERFRRHNSYKENMDFDNSIDVVNNRFDKREKIEIGRKPVEQNKTKDINIERAEKLKTIIEQINTFEDFKKMQSKISQGFGKYFSEKLKELNSPIYNGLNDEWFDIQKVETSSVNISEKGNIENGNESDTAPPLEYEDINALLAEAVEEERYQDDDFRIPYIGNNIQAEQTELKSETGDKEILQRPAILINRGGGGLKF